jgi:hypothetical protein
MIDLPLRKDQLVVEVDADAGLSAVVTPLDDAETIKLMQRAEKLTGEDEELVRYTFEADTLAALFGKHFVRWEGEEVRIGGESFDPQNPRHLEAIPTNWKITVNAELISYATTMSQEMEKN